MKGRLKFEFLTLQLIDTRRKAEHNPSIGGTANGASSSATCGNWNNCRAQSG
jgi:hypothetical protein